GRATSGSPSPSPFYTLMHRFSILIATIVILSGCRLGTDPTPYLVTLTPAATPHTVSSETPVATVTETPSETPTEPAPTSSVPTDTAAPPPPTEVPPTPAPTVDPWPAYMAAPGPSKMGIHVIFNDDPRIMEFIRRVKPRVVKAVDNHGFLAEVKQVSPQTITIGRYTNNPFTSILDGKDPSQYPNPVDFAHNFIDYYINEYRLNPGVEYWEGWNEPQWHTQAEWQWYGEFEANRACFMKDLGFKAAIGGFSAGTPEYANMAYFIPGLEKAAQCNAIFTLHEYSSPTLQTGFNGGIPDAVHVNDAGSLTMRYRYWYEGYIKPRGFTIPLVISEAGIDNGVGDGCPRKDGGQGWYSCYNDWDAMNLGGDKWRVYLDQLAWYDNLLRQDDYVIGFTIFSAGTSATSAWQTFNINDMLVPMAAYMASQ
ncbi:MAG TPA: hypothetical protein VI547_14115, partial [Anaerolineales bacterium]|nr:hypothetical protein [Anaerolineales bacterium]